MRRRVTGGETSQGYICRCKAQSKLDRRISGQKGKWCFSETLKRDNSNVVFGMRSIEPNIRHKQHHWKRTQNNGDFGTETI